MCGVWCVCVYICIQSTAYIDSSDCIYAGYSVESSHDARRDPSILLSRFHRDDEGVCVCVCERCVVEEVVVGDGEKDSSRSRSLSSRLRLSLLEEKVEERDWRLVREASWWARTSSSRTSWVEIRLGEDGEESKSSMNLEGILRIFLFSRIEE